MEELKKKIREVPDFPKPGILFYDLTTLLKDKDGLRSVIDILTEKYKGLGIEKVVGIESRGFIVGPGVAYNLGAGFVPVRKKGKLPAEKITVTYDLEYGQDVLEMHKDAIEPGQRVLIVDDLIATGGTAAATVRMVRQLNGEVTGLAFIVELEFLNGREKLDGYEVFSILRY
ncbi:adenine phosphoribosyltransferase [Acidobacteria bacterium AH-259-O06]|nr:adenine phosphoribosyltransferase [Acidobacteria bacterium AH-259-O06]